MVETSPTDTRADSRHPGVPTYLGVQYLRAFAAIAVVIFHGAQRYGVDFSQGARGVDVFFVISGFIMWTLTTVRQTKPGGFLLDRIKRIVPLYWLATAAVIVAGFVGIVASDQNDLSLASVLKSMFFVPYVAKGATEIWPILTPGWTLNYEMFFYAIFAAFLFAPARARLWGLTATFVVLIALGIAFQPKDSILATYTNALIGHFVAGVWIAEAVRKGMALPPVAAAVAVIAGSAALYFIPWGGALVTLACGLASVSIVAGVVSMDLRKSIPTIPVLRFAGDASYSIYLWHGFALGIAGKLATMLGLPNWLAIVASVASGIVAGMIVYRLIEDPVRKLLSRKRRVAA